MDPITNPIKDPIKDTLVPLGTNSNANGSVRWRTSVYLNLFHWLMGKNSGNHNGVCRYIQAVYLKALLYLEFLYFLVLTLEEHQEKRELLSNISSILSVPAIDDWTL